MSEKRIILKSGSLELDGLFTRIHGEKGVVVAHPHPLYGGSMLNNVVEAICLAYNDCGCSSLRFNFRGVGQSSGSYDNGDGEQEDLKAAISFLADAGISEIELAGYSFGSWVVARGLKGYGSISRIVLVSPPVDLFDFSSLTGMSALKLVIAGSEDNIADWRSVEKNLAVWNPQAVLEVIDGADHFYGEYSDRIRHIIQKFLTQK